MMQVFLSNGQIAQVDDSDYRRVFRMKWSPTLGYAMAKMNGEQIYMHRFILGAEKGQEVDHINGDRLDNRRVNLRLCTRTQNQANRGPQKNNKSGFKGVCWNERSGKYHASIQFKRKTICIGRFDDPLEAAKAYNVAALEKFGEFAWQNPV